MIREGNTGRKAKGGFYRKTESGAREVMNLATGHYVPVHKPKVAAARGNLKDLVTHDSDEGRYAWAVLSRTLAYAAALVGEIAADLEHIDRAMRLGYNWKFGPFELLDKLGPAWFAARLKKEGRPVPLLFHIAKERPLYRTHNGQRQFLTLAGLYQAVPRAPGVLLLEDIKRASQPILRNISASVWDVGDGIACFEFTSKMNSINPLTLMLLSKALKTLPQRGYKGMVIYNEGSNFSVGANIFLLLVAAMFRAWFAVRAIVAHGQSVTTQLKYAPFPVVAAPSGLALGGGCEIVLHSHATVAHAETYIGLVEAGVGIIPGWGGCKELLGRTFALGKKGRGPMPAVAQTFETIATAKVATSAQLARDLLLLRPSDEIVMNRDRLLAAAKTRALALAPHYQKPQPFTYNLPGPSGAAALGLALHDFTLKGLATPHDAVVGTALAHVLTGGSTDVLQSLTEDQLITLERQKFMELAKTPATLARVRYMLKKGKPLRN
jgi:3-hydroxyacyl-CoA dehydrogenase